MVNLGDTRVLRVIHGREDRATPGNFLKPNPRHERKTA